MPIPNTGQISLNDDINSTLQADTNESNVSLGDNNAVKFATVEAGDTITGRSMSELRGQGLFSVNEHKLGQSLHLDNPTSSDNHIIGNPSDYTNTAGTFSFWIKEYNEAHSADNTYISTGSSQSNRIWIRKHTSGSSLDDKIKIAINSVDFISDAILLDKTGWYHHVVSIDTNQPTDANKIRYWINGIELTWETIGNLSDGQNLYFGYNQEINELFYSSGYGFDATYADFKYIDGKALLPSEFGDLKYGIWVPKEVNKQSSSSLITNNLIADYQFEGNANDTSVGGTTYNGTASNVTFEINNYQIADFNGSSSIVKDVLGSGFTYAGETMTFSAWIFVEDASNDNMIIGDGLTTATGGWGISTGYGNAPNRRLNFSVSSSAMGGVQQTYSSVSVSDNTWTHIAVSVDFSSITDSVKMYINGVEDTSLTDGISGTFVENTTYNTSIGGTWTGSAGRLFEGKIGEVQIYSDVLTSAEVLQNYNATKYKYFYGLNGWHLPLSNKSTGSIVSDTSLELHLDASNSSSYGGSGTTWSDLSGNSNTATIYGSPNYSSANGGYFNFDGSDSNEATVSHNTALDITSTGFTVEAWVNPDDTNYNTLMSKFSTSASIDGYSLAFNTGDIFWRLYTSSASVGTCNYTTGQVATTSTWHHIVGTVSGTASGSTMRLYQNGTLLNTTTTTATYVATTRDLKIGGYDYASSRNFDGKIAAVRIYSKALSASEVAQNYKATQGNYEQISLVDISGNANGFNAGGSNLTYQAYVESKPSENYATLRTQSLLSGPSLTRGNLRCTNTNSYFAQFESTLAATSGKWYAEVTVVDEGNNTIQIGAASQRTIHWNGSPTNNINGINAGYTLWNMDNDSAGNYAVIYVDGSRPQTSTNYKAVDGDVCGILLNLDDSEVTFYKNNVIVDQARSITRDSDELTYFVATTRTSSGQGVLDWNFGQKAFAYSLPSGYKALATHNLPAITISPDDKEKPRDHFDIVTWNGNGLKQDIKGLDFKPDLLITKNFTNSGNYHWCWVDSVRGIDEIIYSSSLSEGIDSTDSFMDFNSDGFSIGTNSDSQNASNVTKSGYIAYAFKGGGAAVLNEQGTIDSQVSANQTAGFSIVKYTGNTTSGATVGHGLNSAPELVMIKTLQTGPGYTGWAVQAAAIGGDKYLWLDQNNAQQTSSGYFNNTLADSNVVTLGNFDVTNDGTDIIAYCFHSVPGYSKIGTYEGNGSTNGPFVYTGFKPKFIMLKNLDDVGNWIIHDTARESSNNMINHLRFNTTGIEDNGASERIQVFSNGFKLIGSGQNINHAETYLYLAIAEDSVIYSQGTAKESGVEKFIDQTDLGTSGYPDKYFKSVTYTGNGSSQFIETGFKPGLTWLKKRTNDAKHHRFFDTVRGAGSAVYSPSTSGATSDEGITQFNDNGFVLGSPSGTNENGDTFVSWNWKAGDTIETKKPTYTDAGIYTTNLQLHYNFANSSTYSGSGTTVTDISTNTNNGTLANGAAFKDNAYGNYINFDGSNDYIDSGLSTALGTGDFSIEVWLYQDNENNYNMVWGDQYYGSTSGNGIGFYVKNGYFALWIHNTSSTALNIFPDTSFQAARMKANEWSHLVVTRKDGTFKGYINGVLAITNTNSQYDLDYNATDAYIFQHYNAAGTYNIPGKLGQFRIYSSELTTSQIQGNYNATKTLYQGLGTTANVLQTNLALNYDFDDFDTYDTSWGSDNKAAVLNGSSSIIQSSIPKTVLNNNFSVSFWWKPNLMNTFQVPMGGLYDETGGIAYGWMVYQGSDNKMYLYWIISSSPNTSNFISNNVVLEQGKWYHVVATKTSSGASIHVNGSSASSSPAQGNQFNIVYNTNPTFYIGKRNVSNSYANGTIDQVRLFNKQVSSTEIKKLFSEKESQNNTLQILGDTSCIATYNFNGNYNDLSTNYNASQSNVTLSLDSAITSNRVTDKTSNNNSGNIYGGLVEKNNVGKYLSLDGSNDYVEGPSASSIISSGATAVTIEGWVYMESHPSAFDGIIGAMNATSPFGGWMIYNHHTTDNFGFAINVNGTWNSIDGNANIELNKWIHVAATYDGEVMKFYKNGKNTMYYRVAGSIAYPSGDVNFRIGRNASAYADMRCAQARVYTSAITSSQVKANYDATKEQFYGALVHADVSVNDKSGFSIAKWTGTGVSGITVPHGMAKAPEVIFTKGLSNPTSWVSGVGGMTEYDSFDYMQISTQGDISNSSTFYQAYESTGFTAGVSSANEFNKNDSNEYISYCWRSIPGYSKIGVYNGTGTTNDIYTGFQPRWVMIKRSDADNYWVIFDAARSSAKDMSQVLWANVSDVEAAGGNATSILTSPTGFSMDSSAVGGSINANGGTYMYMAFA